MLERETKLTVGEGFTVPPLHQHAAGEAPEPERRALVDTYYDTDDLRLARWGCTLRRRNERRWTVKLPVAKRRAGPGAMERYEVDFDAGDTCPRAAVELVGSYTRGRPIELVAQLSTERTAWTYRDDDGRALFEVVDDRVVGRGPDGTSRSFRQLEVELAPTADGAVLDEVVAELTAAGAELDRAEPKLVRVLGPAAGAAPDVVRPVLGPTPTARDVIADAIARSVDRLVRHIPVARLGHDVEGVHQARVATRTLRSDLRTFKPFLRSEPAESLQVRLRALAAALGRVRDADVLLGHLQAVVDDHSELDTEAGRRVLHLLEQDRALARSALKVHLASGRTLRLLDDLVAAAADPPTNAEADRPAAVALPPLVAKRWRRLAKAVHRLGPDPVVDDLHQVRILAKRARYAAEAVRPAVGPPAKEFARALAGVQDVLGELNDAAVAEGWLAGAVHRLDPEAAFAAGRLAQVMAEHGARHRSGWEEAFARAERPKRRAWFAEPSV